MPTSRFRLSARREARLPTVWGWLAIALVLAAFVWLLGIAAYPFLAVDAPARGADGTGARTLVVEGWLDSPELDRVAPFLRGRRYERVLTTGGPLRVWGAPPVSSAERAAGYLRSHGVAAVPVIAVPAPESAQERTFLSASMLRDWAERTGTRLDAVDVFTLGVHARRSRSTFRLALGPSVEVGVVPADPNEFEGGRWWRSSSGAKAVVGELVSNAWTSCCFWPDEPGSHGERPAQPASTH